MKARKGYFKGMNQDSALSKAGPNNYYSATNYRVTSEAGSSAGVLETEKGNKLSFTIPNVPEMELENETIPAQYGLQVVGWGSIVDTIIIFTTNQTGTTPNGTVSQIWKLKYDERTNEVIGLTSSGELDVDTHLIYNNVLSLSTQYRVGRVIGRFENEEMQRVYWTDNYNSVRSVNTADPDLINLDPDNIDLRPNAKLTQPVIQSIGSGSLPAGAMVQVTYRLLDKEGGVETKFAPNSALYPLPLSNAYSGSFGSFEGDGAGELTRSLTYTIKGIDTDFKVIQHYIVIYSSENVPTVYKFDEEEVPETGEIEVTATSISEAIQIPLVEFNVLSSGFDVAKDIEVKDNKLIAANTKTLQFDLDDSVFDARVYRFNSSKTALLKDDIEGDVSLLGPSPNYANVPFEHNAINPYNKEQNANWSTSLQYKYQADGVTYGGSGPNISYKFVTRDQPSNFRLGVTYSPDHVEVDRATSGFGDLDIGTINEDGTAQTADRAGQLKNMAAPAHHAYSRGYARGETYRFAIVFYNTKGGISFAKWIGDIRFPEPIDGYPIQTLIGTVPYMYSLGIEFDVDISSIKNIISGYSIVRVQRTKEERTKVGTGMQMFFKSSNGDGDLINNASDSGPTVVHNVNINGQEVTNSIHLNDKPGPVTSHGNTLSYLESPLGRHYIDDFKEGDFLKTYGYYYSFPHIFLENNSEDKYLFEYKMLDFIPTTDSQEIYQISNASSLGRGEYMPSNTSLIAGVSLPTIGTNFALRNSSYCDEDNNTPMGMGNPKLAMIMSQSPTIAHNSGPANTTNWLGGPNTQYNFLIFSNDKSFTPVAFKEVAYSRYVDNQYGGDTFEDKSVNQYISTNHYQVVGEATPSLISSEVYGGDVFVNYYDAETMHQYWNPTNDPFNSQYDSPETDKIGIGIVCPVETPINTDYRAGVTYASGRNSLDPDSQEFFAPTYNFVWSQENNVSEKFFAKDFLIETIEEHPHQLWASETKLDGELIDSWKIFKTANKTEVNGVYGPINRIINFRDQLYFYQDKAFGSASINERSTITDDSGQQLVLGQGGVFPDYRYISTATGTVHQFSVTASDRAIFHYDARLNKIYSYSGQGVSPLSDLKGMSTFLENEVSNNILGADKTILGGIGENPVGVHSIPDLKGNRALFTFLSHKPLRYLTNVATDGYSEGEVIADDKGKYYLVKEPFRISDLDAGAIIETISQVELLENYVHGFTISYNEEIGAFESFHDYKPKLYLQYGRRMLSANPFAPNEVYEHNKGNWGEFYGNYYDSKLITVLNDQDHRTKIFNNLDYKAELYDEIGKDLYLETFRDMRVYNEYQDTGVVDLTIGDNVGRRMRGWKIAIPRDKRDGKSRIRNPWTFLELRFQNNDNKRQVLHDLIFSYTPSDK